MKLRDFWRLFAADVRTASFWCKFGIIGLAGLSIYLLSTQSIEPDLLIEYPFLTDAETIVLFSRSKTIVVVQKSATLVKKIKSTYGELAVFCQAKNKRELAEEVQTFCTRKEPIIVVKAESLCEKTEKYEEKSLDPLPALAEQFNYTLFITDPSLRPVPVYTGWLINEKDSRELLSESRRILKYLLETNEKFYKDIKNYTEATSVEDAVNYFGLAASNSNGMLHCTAKYLGKGTAPGSLEYWNSSEIQSNLGRAYKLKVIGFVWTPRTFGARVKLNKDEMDLWGNDGDNLHFSKHRDAALDPNNPFNPVEGPGARAHITIGVADGVQAVVTGQDILEIVFLETLHMPFPTYASMYGWLRNYEHGSWVLYKEESLTVSGMFGSVYPSKKAGVSA